MVAFLRALSIAAGALPWRWMRPIGALLGWLAGTVLRIRRTHVDSSMRAAGIGDAPRAARRMYRELGASAMELLWLAGSGPRAVAHAYIDEASVQPWRSALALGRGVVVAASHTGNWDFAACAMAQSVELLVVTKRLRIRGLDNYWQSLRADCGVKLVDTEGALDHARRTLRRGGAVAMMIDQAPACARQARQANPVEFLGRTALVDRAPAALAARSGAPLVVASSRRDQTGEHVLHVLAVLHPEPPLRLWVEQATALATAALDGFVRSYPDQWLWLHRRWKRLDRIGGPVTLGAPCTIRSSSRAAPSKAA